MRYVLALGLNLFFGFYMLVIKPVSTYVQAYKMGRRLKAMRVAGL